MRHLVPRWFAVLIAFSLAIVTYGSFTGIDNSPSSPSPSGQIAAPAELLDTMWIDTYPQVAHDPWRAYLFTSENVGISINAHSAFKLLLELFEFKSDNRSIAFHFPHDARRARCNYKVEKMKKPTKHFDTVLTIENDPQNNGQTSTYYTGPEFRSRASLPAVVRGSLSERVLQALPE